MTGAEVRPGGRAARVRSALLDAAATALVECGPAGFDLAELARRAGIGKTTVYRRWGTVGAVVGDLVADMAETSLPRADTGTLDGDLAANADLVRATLADPRQGRLFAALVAAATADPATADALRDFYDRRISEWQPCVADAVARGELDPGTDTAAVVRAVSAPLYYRLLTRGEPPTEDDARRAAGAAAAAARAGVFLS
ncbi:TetR-like C-terminal domain-containing protein [Actinomycetospora flava]|uniref:TetR-like C-terminal domain-containing protein n=1 Tax=Actinomycetospora flava TaxID=3129232 RepID=A0ABU8M828_9PSEU